MSFCFSASAAVLLLPVFCKTCSATSFDDRVGSLLGLMDLGAGENLDGAGLYRSGSATFTTSKNNQYDPLTMAHWYCILANGSSVLSANLVDDDEIVR